MKVELYTRVSTDMQTTDVQVEPLKAWIEALGHEVGEIYEDVISGTKRERPELDRLIERCKAGEVEAIAIIRLDRLARSTQHLLELSDQFQEWGVDLMIREGNIDTSTPAGKLIYTVLGAIATFERDLIAERTKAGLAHARAKGVKLGRPKAVELSKVDAQVLVERHGSQRAAAAAIGVSRMTISRALRQEDRAA